MFRKSSSTAKEYGNEGLVIDNKVEGSKVEGVSKSFGKFEGIRIHQGTSEKSSEGCIIVSRTRKSDGTLVKDIGCAQQLTKFTAPEVRISMKNQDSLMTLGSDKISDFG